MRKFLRTFSSTIGVIIGIYFLFVGFLLLRGYKDLRPYKDKEIQKQIEILGKNWKIYWVDKKRSIKKRKISEKKENTIFELKSVDGRIEYFDVSKNEDRLAVWIDFYKEEKSELWLIDFHKRLEEKIYTSYYNYKKRPLHLNCWFSLSGKKLTFSCYENFTPKVFVYDIEKRFIEKTIENATGAKIFPNDEKMIAYTNQARQLFIREIQTGKEFKIADNLPYFPILSSFAVSPKGNWIVWMEEIRPKAIYLLNIKTKYKIKLTISYPGDRWISECKWSPLGNYILISERRTGSWFGAEKPVIVDLKTGKKSDLLPSFSSFLKFFRHPVVVE